MGMIEFRLYHNNGKFLCYTCENLEGDYIVIDAETYAIGNPHVKVVNGKIEPTTLELEISKFVLSDIGTKCAFENICIVVDKEYNGLTKTYSYEPVKL